MQSVSRQYQLAMFPYTKDINEYDFYDLGKLILKDIYNQPPWWSHVPKPIEFTSENKMRFLGTVVIRYLSDNNLEPNEVDYTQLFADLKEQYNVKS